MPVLFCVFGWGTLVSNHLTAGYFPREPGLAPYSGVTLLGIYVVVRFLKTSGWLDRLSVCHAAVIAALSAVFVFGGVYQYDSPFCLALAVSLLVLFSRIPIAARSAGIINLIAPSMFAVYLYHTGPFFRCIHTWEAAMVEGGLPQIEAIVVMAVCVFVGGVALDFPRRVFVRFVNSVLSNSWKGVRCDNA